MMKNCDSIFWVSKTFLESTGLILAKSNHEFMQSWIQHVKVFLVLFWHLGMWKATWGNTSNRCPLAIYPLHQSDCCTSKWTSPTFRALAFPANPSAFLIHEFMPQHIPYFILLELESLRYLTFWRRYTEKWKNILRFLPPNCQASCDECIDAKERFRRARES